MSVATGGRNGSFRYDQHHTLLPNLYLHCSLNRFLNWHICGQMQNTLRAVFLHLYHSSNKI